MAVPSSRRVAARCRDCCHSHVVSAPRRAWLLPMAAKLSRKPLLVGAARDGAAELCVIVNENNEVVDAQPRDITVRNRLLGRGSYCLVFDKARRLFVSQRAKNKDVYPGLLDVVISGVVAVGESYADTAARELNEELGIPNPAAASGLQQLCTFPYKDDVCHVWGALFTLTWDGPIAFQDREVEWGMFLSPEEVQQRLSEDPTQFTPVGRHVLQLYLADHAAQQPSPLPQQ